MQSWTGFFRFFSNQKFSLYKIANKEKKAPEGAAASEVLVAIFTSWN